MTAHRPRWAEIRHRSVVPYAVWSNRLTIGWDMERALTTPSTQRQDRRALVRAILADDPAATPKQIAKRVGGGIKQWEVRDILLKLAQPVEPQPVPKPTTPGAAWVHPIRRRALGLPVAPKGYAIGS